MKNKFIAPLRIDIPDLKKSISLGSLRIRRIKKQEITKFFNISDPEYDLKGNLVGAISLNHDDPLNHLDACMLKACQYVVENTDQKLMIMELNNLLLALRLYKDGNIYAPIVFHSESPNINFIYPQFTKESEKYTITIAEFSKIKKIVKLINKNNDFKLKFERFNNAIDKKTNDKNAFIDFVTILESLFLNNSGNHELSFTFSLYTSYILRNKLNIKSTFQEMKNIYNIRSQLVHRGKSKEYTKELFKNTKKITRQLILWALEDGNISYKYCKKIILKHLNVN